MDEEICEMIDDLVDELYFIMTNELITDMIATKDDIKNLLERKITWVINYTHKDDK